MWALNGEEEIYLHNIVLKIHSAPSIPDFLSDDWGPLSLPCSLHLPVSRSLPDIYQVAGPISKLLTLWFWNILADHSITPRVSEREIGGDYLNTDVSFLPCWIKQGDKSVAKNDIFHLRGTDEVEHHFVATSAPEMSWCSNPDPSAYDVFFLICFKNSCWSVKKSSQILRWPLEADLKTDWITTEPWPRRRSVWRTQVAALQRPVLVVSHLPGSAPTVQPVYELIRLLLCEHSAPGFWWLPPAGYCTVSQSSYQLKLTVCSVHSNVFQIAIQ